MGDIGVGEVIIFVIAGATTLGLMLLFGFFLLNRKENRVNTRIQDTYEKINKEFVSGDQAVQKLSDSKIEKTNESIVNIADSVQDIENKGGDTVIAGDLCINNTCFSSSSANATRINLDELKGLTSKYLQNCASVNAAVTTSDIEKLRAELTRQITEEMPPPPAPVAVNENMCFGLTVPKTDSEGVVKTLQIVNDIAKLATTQYICTQKSEVMNMIDKYVFDDQMCNNNFIDEQVIGTPFEKFVNNLKELQKIVCKDGKVDQTTFKQIAKDFVNTLC
jgi:hypothetical protein